MDTRHWPLSIVVFPCGQGYRLSPQTVIGSIAEYGHSWSPACRKRRLNGQRRFASENPGGPANRWPASVPHVGAAGKTTSPGSRYKMHNKQTTMDQHKYIIASDRDLLGNWTEPNVIEVQSLPASANGARGIVVQGVGMTNKQKGGATRSKGGQQHTVLMEHFSQHGSASAATTVVGGGGGTTQVIVAHQGQQQQQPQPQHQATDAAASSMINTLRPAKTKLGKARIRMKWTTEVNEYILRTYYMITQLETNCKHYRDTLHRLFNEEFPDVEVCAQRIADQRRAIVKNHLLTQERIDEIRREVELDLQSAGEMSQQQQQQHPPHSMAVTTSSLGSGPIIVSTPIMTMSKDHHPVTVWYGCVKEEQPDTDGGGYQVPGPSGHKLRKLNHGQSLSVGVTQQQQQQPQHIIIHTTSDAHKR